VIGFTPRVIAARSEPVPLSALFVTVAGGPSAGLNPKVAAVGEINASMPGLTVPDMTPTSLYASQQTETLVACHCQVCQLVAIPVAGYQCHARAWPKAWLNVAPRWNVPSPLPVIDCSAPAVVSQTQIRVSITGQVSPRDRSHRT